MSEAVTVPPVEETQEDAPVPTRRLLVFMLASRPFACDMDSFREIIPTRQTTRLPGAPSTVSGLINLRGTIVTVLDGGVLLGAEPCIKTGGLTLLVDLDGRLVGFGVDDINDLYDVPITEFAAPGPDPAVAHATSQVEIDGRTVVVVDIKSVARQVIGQGR